MGPFFITRYSMATTGEIADYQRTMYGAITGEDNPGKILVELTKMAQIGVQTSNSNDAQFENAHLKTKLSEYHNRANTAISQIFDLQTKVAKLAHFLDSPKALDLRNGDNHENHIKLIINDIQRIATFVVSVLEPTREANPKKFGRAPWDRSKTENS